MNNSERDVKQAAMVFTRQLLNLKQDQRLLVYVDQGSDLNVAGAIQDAAKETGAKADLLELKSDLKLNDVVRKLVNTIEKEAFDVICELSEQYFYPTLVWKRALQLGSQIYSLGGVHADAFIRCVGKVNHELMFQFGMALKRLLEKATHIQIVTTQGTNLALQMKSNSLFFRLISMLKTRQKPYVLYPSGVLEGTCRATFLGGQLAFQGFPETIRGTVVIDGYLWPPRDMGRLETPVVAKIKKGKVVAIDGGTSKSKIIDQWFDGRNRDIQHFCIGFNPGAKLTGKIMEAERVFGCIALGIGKFPFHSDGIIKNPSILIDNEIIEQDGCFTHEELSTPAQHLTQDYEAKKRNPSKGGRKTFNGNI